MSRFRILFIITVFAFALTNYPLAGSIGTLARYASLALLVIVVALSSGLESRGVKIILPVFGLFLLDCLATGFWSQNYWLSVLKLIVYAITTVGLLIGGVHFNRSSLTPGSNPFLPLGFVFVPAVVTSVACLAMGMGFDSGNFRGLTGNANTLGAMIALSSPWLIFELNKGLGRRWRKLALLALSVFGLICLVLSHSRASMCTFIVICLLSIWGMKLSRRFAIVYTIAMVMLLILAANQTFYRTVYEQFVLKRSMSLTSSRGDQMETSWEMAKKGGLLGLGFGVSDGAAQYWKFGTFSSFSREKGNSQMAILEETGVVGFVLYLAFTGAVLLALRTNYPKGTLIGPLCVGLFLAGIMHSAFEAWFLSTGPECAFFWTGLGLSLGVLDRVGTVAKAPDVPRIAAYRHSQ